MAKGTAYTKQFKEDAIRYKKEHPELSYQAAASNLNISISALKTWIKKSKENEGKGERRKSPNPGGWQLFQRRGKGNRQAAARTS